MTPSSLLCLPVVQGLHRREYVVAILGSIRNTRSFLAAQLRWGCTPTKYMAAISVVITFYLLAGVPAVDQEGKTRGALAVSPAPLTLYSCPRASQ